MLLNASFIKEKALELGFQLVGIASAARFPEAELYRKWLASGYAGEMGYLSRHIAQREDCRVLFPPARSVIVCGLSYHTSLTPVELENPCKGRIAKYAWGDDYHVILKDKLNALLAFMQAESPSPVEAKICVDTVPILERLCGRYAGLGWIGKNGCLINQRYGSWFFLGEILINLDLEYDTPVPDRCGTCTRCLDACPTNALVAPRLLDARRCLSYLTIELKGVIPEALRPALRNRVFGCDQCQTVCPWNAKAAVSEHPAFAPRNHLYQPDLDWLLTLSAETFHKTFHHNPIKRTKLRGLLRNTVVAIGNSGKPAFIPLLQNLYDHVEPMIQTHITWAIQQLQCWV
jgi:epoxyqueuosine reductase